MKLRAEILFEFPNINPFQSAKGAIEREPLLINMCAHKGYLAYESKLTIKCYGNPNMLTKIDSNGRRFWYHPKWK